MRAKKVDNNQAEVVAALKKLGCQVFDTSGIGRGYPDLNVCMKGETFLVEIKNGGDRKWYYTPAQKKLRAGWRGAPIYTLTTVDEAIAFVNNVIGNRRYGL